jgi:hypothetical protein
MRPCWRAGWQQHAIFGTLPKNSVPVFWEGLKVSEGHVLVRQPPSSTSFVRQVSVIGREVSATWRAQTKKFSDPLFHVVGMNADIERIYTIADQSQAFQFQGIKHAVLQLRSRKWAL